MPLWSGREWSGGKSLRKILRCIIRRSQNDWGPNGKRWPKAKSDLSSMKPKGFEPNICKTIQITNTAQDESLKTSKHQDILILCPTHQCPWRPYEQVTIFFFHFVFFQTWKSNVLDTLEVVSTVLKIVQEYVSKEATIPTVTGQLLAFAAVIVEPLLAFRLNNGFKNYSFILLFLEIILLVNERHYFKSGSLLRQRTIISR